MINIPINIQIKIIQIICVPLNVIHERPYRALYNMFSVDIVHYFDYNGLYFFAQREGRTGWKKRIKKWKKSWKMG